MTKSSSGFFFSNKVLDKGELKKIIQWFFEYHGYLKTVNFVEKIKTLGFSFATKAGVSLGIDDLYIPPRKAILLSNASKELRAASLRYMYGYITAVERLQQSLNIWNLATDSLKKDIIQFYIQTNPLNPVYMMAFSGARGNLSQVRQLVGLRGLMSNPSGEIIELPILSNFREGLTVTEYVISCYGARKGLVDTALRTADAGYLTRRLVDVAHHVILQEKDCHTKHGIKVFPLKQQDKTLLKVEERLLGRTLARPVFSQKGELLAVRNQQIYSNLAQLLSKKASAQVLLVRSPLTCLSKKSLCQYCYGWNLASGKLADLGEAVGILAAQSIGEPGTQLTMRTFHTGGVFTGQVTEHIYAPFEGTIFFHKNDGVYVRTLLGKSGFLTKKAFSLFLQDTKKYVHRIRLPEKSVILVENGTYVKKSTKLVDLYTGQEDSGLSGAETTIQKNVYSELNGEISFEKAFGSIFDTTNQEKPGATIKIPVPAPTGGRPFWISSCQSFTGSNFGTEYDLIEKNSLLHYEPTCIETSNTIVNSEATKSFFEWNSITSVQNKIVDITDVKPLFFFFTAYKKYNYFEDFDSLEIYKNSKMKIKKIFKKRKEGRFLEERQKLTTIKNLFVHPDPKFILFHSYNASQKELFKLRIKKKFQFLTNSSQQMWGIALEQQKVNIDNFEKINSYIDGISHLSFFETSFSGLSNKPLYIFPTTNIPGSLRSFESANKGLENILRFNSKRPKLLTQEKINKSQLVFSRILNHPFYSNSGGELLYSLRQPFAFIYPKTRRRTKPKFHFFHSKYKKLENINTFVFLPSEVQALENKNFSRLQALSLRSNSELDVKIKYRQFVQKGETLSSQIKFATNTVLHLIALPSGILTFVRFVTPDNIRLYKSLAPASGLLSISQNEANTRKLNCKIEPGKIYPLTSTQAQQYGCYNHSIFFKGDPVFKLSNKELVSEDVFYTEIFESHFPLDVSNKKQSLPTSFDNRKKDIAKPRINIGKVSIDRQTGKEKKRKPRLEVLITKPTQETQSSSIQSRFRNLQNQYEPTNENKYSKTSYLFFRPVNIYFFSVQNYTFPWFLKKKTNQNIKILPTFTLLTNVTRKVREASLKHELISINYLIQASEKAVSKPLLTQFTPSKKANSTYSLQISEFEYSYFGHAENILQRWKYISLALPLPSLFRCTNLKPLSVENRLVFEKFYNDLERLNFETFSPFFTSLPASYGNWRLPEYISQRKPNTLISKQTVSAYGSLVTLSTQKGEWLTKPSPKPLQTKNLFLTNTDLAKIKFPFFKRNTFLQTQISPGQLIHQGDLVSGNYSSPIPGQVFMVTRKDITIRFSSILLGPYNSLFFCEKNKFVEAGERVFSLIYKTAKTGDIVQGLPRVEALLEGRKKQGKSPFVEKIIFDICEKNYQIYLEKYGLKKAVRICVSKLQLFLVDQIQYIYHGQGVKISDKHIEIIVKQMTKKVRIENPGGTPFLATEIVDLDLIEQYNEKVTEPAEYFPWIIGITSASLTSESFLSAASFQETTSVLARASLEGQIDWLHGLKENVLLGRLIPAGTGFLPDKPAFSKSSFVLSDQTNKLLQNYDDLLFDDILLN